jgi:hypothetical protein
LNEGVLANIIGGWQISNIFIAQSGAPLSITASGRCSTRPATAHMPDQDRTREHHWRSRTRLALLRSEQAYAQPANATQGNMKRNSGPEGPGFWELGLVALQALQRRREALRAEIHVDA